MPVTLISASTAGQGKALFVDAGDPFPAAGWELPGFVDSAWTTPVLQTMDVFGPAPGSSVWITDSATGRNPYSSTLFRFHFTLTSIPAAVVITMAADNLISSLWSNGQFLFQNMTGNVLVATTGVYPGNTIIIPASMLVVGDNVLAVHIYNGAGDASTNPISIAFIVQSVAGWLIINEPSAGLTDQTSRLFLGGGAKHSFTSQLRQRGQAEIELYIRAGDSYRPVRACPLYLFDQTSSGYTLEFSGLIQDIQDKLIDDAGNRYVTITAVSLESVLDTVCAPPYQYENKTCGYIVADLLSRLEGGSPVTLGDIDIAGSPVVPLLNTNYEKISDLISQLATTALFTWGVDPSTQQLFFHSPASVTAPFTLTGDRVLFDSIEWKQTGADFRNWQGIRLNANAFSHSMEFFVGAGQKTFTLQRPVNQVTNAYATLSTCNTATGSFSGNPSPGDTVSISIPAGPGFGWVASHVYGAGGVIVDAAGFVQKITSPGTSGPGPSPPVFKDIVSETTIDGSVIWECQGALGLSTGLDVYTFVAALDNVEFGQVLIGDTHAITNQNLMDAINATEARAGNQLRGVTYSLPTWENALCNAINNAGISFTLQQKAAGSGWISSLAASSSAFSWNSAVTFGGTSPQGSLGPNEGATISLQVYVEGTSTAAPALSYTPGSAVVNLATPLNVGSNLNVEYTRAGGDVIAVEDTDSVQALAAITHGTGKYQQITDASSTGLIATSAAAGLQFAQQALAAYKTAPQSVMFSTHIPGLRAGMMLTVALSVPVSAVLNGTWLIEEISAELFPYKKIDPRFGHYIFKIKLVNIQEIGSYLDFWAGMGSGKSGAGGGAGTGSALVATSGGAISPSAVIQFITCTQATFPVLSSSNKGRFIYVSDYAHLIYWDGVSPKFADGGNCFVEGFEVDPAGPGWALCDGSATHYLNPDGTLTAHTTKNLVGSPAYLKYGATATGIDPAVPAGLTGSTASAVTGASVGDSVGGVDAGDGTHGTATFVTTETLIDPGHVHAKGSLVTDSLGEPPHIQLRPWFRL